MMKKQNNANDLDLTIDPKKLQALFATNAYRHAFAMLLNWVIIFTTIYYCIQFFNPLTYLLAVIIVGARMHALAILMHDATHFSFLKKQKWNDLITDFFITYPVFTSIAKYRQNHLRHHRHLNSENDPDWVAKLTKREFTFPKTKREFLTTVFSYLLLFQGAMDAYWFLKRFSGGKKEKSQKAKKNYARTVFFVLLFTTLTLTGTWKYYLLFWVVPYLSTFFMFQYIRSVAEHFGELAYDHLLTSTRTVKATLIEQFFIAPHHVGYHLEHHLYPGVPFYHLPKLHDLLMEDSDYGDQAHITQGYVRGLLNELGKVEKQGVVV
ncbi:MAG: fatty acid desaturase family protein [Bacteroidota bacterium]